MVKLIVLDKNGHSLVTENVETEFRRLVKDGYAAFLENVQIDELPLSGDVTMLAPLAGG